MASLGLRSVLCGLVLACTACAVVPAAPPPAPRVVAAAPSAPQPGYCREYQQTVIIGGVQQQAYGVSCQQADGSWKLVGGQQATGAAPPRPVAQSAAMVAPAQPYPAPPYDGSYLLIPYARASGDDTQKSEK
jgi:hypothetical protein